MLCIALPAALGWLAMPTVAATLWTDVPRPDDPEGRQWIAWFDSSSPWDLHWVGPTGVSLEMDGLDFAGNGQLYGVMDQTFFLIDQQTGNAQPLGYVIPPDPWEILFDLSWDPVTNTMFGLSWRATGSSSEHRLYTIDLETGQGTLYGLIDGYTEWMPPGGLATDASGVRWIDDSRHLYYLDPVDPEGWVVANQFPIYHSPDACFIGGMTIDWAGNGLAYHATVNLDHNQAELWIYDLSVPGGNAYCAGTIGDGTSTLPLDVAIQIPEPNTLVAMGLLLATAARRRD